MGEAQSYFCLTCRREFTPQTWHGHDVLQDEGRVEGFCSRFCGHVFKAWAASGLIGDSLYQLYLEEQQKAEVIANLGYEADEH